MAITIVSTSGSASANSFVSEAEAIAFMATRLNAEAWTTTTGSSLTESEKKALVMATRELSAKRWVGRKATDEQMLAWPRQWAPDPDSPTQDYYATTAIPQRVKNATCELAFQYMHAGSTDLSVADAGTGIKRKKVGPLETEYETHSTPKGITKYTAVLAEIRPLLAGSSYTASVVRG